MKISSGTLAVDVDPPRGGEIVSLLHKPSSVSILFKTPWHQRAELLAEHNAPSAFADDRSDWLERYRGGWQVLAPLAGPGALVGDTYVGFHGELSRAPFSVVSTTPGSVAMRGEMMSVPIAVERTVSVQDSTVTVNDVLTNTSRQPARFDYVSHPAFGQDFLDGVCTIEVSGRTITLDNRPTEPKAWPSAPAPKGWERLNSVPREAQDDVIFGWVSDLYDGSASITNESIGLCATLRWDREILGCVWVWEELNASKDFPWFGRARVVALEPSSRPTHVTGAGGALEIAGFESLAIDVSMTIERKQIAHQ